MGSVISCPGYGQGFRNHTVSGPSGPSVAGKPLLPHRPCGGPPRHIHMAWTYNDYASVVQYHTASLDAQGITGKHSLVNSHAIIHDDLYSHCQMHAETQAHLRRPPGRTYGARCEPGGSDTSVAQQTTQAVTGTGSRPVSHTASSSTDTQSSANPSSHLDGIILKRAPHEPRTQ